MELMTVTQSGFVKEGELNVLSYHLTYPKTERYPKLDAYYADFLQKLEASVRSQGYAYGKAKLQAHIEAGGSPRRFRPTVLTLTTEFSPNAAEEQLTVTQTLRWKDGKRILTERTECHTWDLSQKEPVLCKNQTKEKRKFHLPILAFARFGKKAGSRTGKK